jgi:hypothetical protein
VVSQIKCRTWFEGGEDRVLGAIFGRDTEVDRVLGAIFGRDTKVSER